MKASQVSSIKPYDCAAAPGAIQVLKEGGDYDVKQLDIPTGKYNLVYVIPATRTNPAYTALNGVAINPIDGIAYGMMNLGNKNKIYLVRFDKDAVEFVAMLSGWSVVGTVSFKGHFYYIYKNDLYVVRDIHTLQGFSSQNGNLPKLVTKLGDGPGPAVQDLVAWTGDLEGNGVEEEWVFALASSKKLLVIKDRGGSAQFWRLDTIGNEETIGFGAGWNFKGKVYFAGNSGDGVYYVPTEVMTIQDSAVLVKKVGESEATRTNDGMNCMSYDSPFPPPEPGCGSSLSEVPAQVDGSCPPGSFRG